MELQPCWMYGVHWCQRHRVNVSNSLSSLIWIEGLAWLTEAVVCRQAAHALRVEISVGVGSGWLHNALLMPISFLKYWSQVGLIHAIETVVCSPLHDPVEG